MQGQTRACVCVLHYSGGTLQDKEYTFFHVTESDPAEVLSSFIKQYYAQRNAVAKTVLLSHEIEEQDAVGEYLSSIAERKVELAVPQRGRTPGADPPRGEKRLRGDRTQREAVRETA